MKYKQGEKMIVEITEVKENSYVLNKIGEVEPMEAKIRRQAAEITRLLAENKKLKEDFEKSKRVNLNMGRIAGQNEAWELARKITCQPINGGFNRSEFEKIFDEGYISDIFEKYTYQETAAKVAEWEKAKDEIKVGDIVKTKCDTSFEFCVTYIDCNGYLYGLGRYGATYSDKNPEDWENTGRHIDIDSFLKQIGGNEEE